MIFDRPACTAIAASWAIYSNLESKCGHFGGLLGSLFGHFWGHFLDHFLITFWTFFGCHFGADGPGVIFTAGLGVIFTAGLGVIVTSWRLGLIRPYKAF